MKKTGSRRVPGSMFIASAIRGSRKFVFLIVGLLLLSIIVVLQYKDFSTQYIIYHKEVLSRFLSKSAKTGVTSPYSTSGGTDYVKNLHRSVNASKATMKKPNAVQVHFTTKTSYPVTINAPYLMENPSLCASVKNLSVLVIVHTAPSHFDRRKSIRQTWTNQSYLHGLGKTKVLFLLGRVKDPNIQVKLRQEFRTHRDLLQGDFIDAYRNLTHKGVMAYKWISERCRNAKFILKVDDDITVNMYKLFTEVLPAYKNKRKQILCNHIRPGTMLIIRDKKSKWYVNEDYFRGQKFYPRYCSGFLVLFTNDVIPAMYRSASLTPFFWVDDVYLYGLVPSHVPDIQYNDLKKGSHQLNGNLAVKCYRNVTRTCDFLVTGAGKQSVMKEIWDNMGKLYEKVKSKVIRTEKPTTTSMITDAYHFSTRDASSATENKSFKPNRTIKTENRPRTRIKHI